MPPLLPLLLKLGVAAGTTIGSWIHNNRQRKKALADQKNLMALQLQNQQTLNQQQYEKQRLLNEQGQEIQMDTFRRTGPGAQIGMLKDAGLNASLLYGKGGMGGSTLGSQTGGSAGGGSAAMGSAPAPNYIDIVSASNAAADIKLKEAQARNLNVDSDNKEGKGGEKLQGEINNLKAGTDLIISQVQTENVKREGIVIDNALKNIDLYINDKTKEFKIESVEQELEKIKNSNLQIIEQTRGSNIENNKKEELINSQIKLNNQQVATSYFQSLYTKAQTELTKGQLDNMLKMYDLEVQRLAQNVEITKLNNEQSGENARIHADAMEYAAQVSGTGHLLGDIQKTFAQQFGKKTLPPNPGGGTNSSGGTRNVTINNYGPTPRTPRRR